MRWSEWRLPNTVRRTMNLTDAIAYATLIGFAGTGAKFYGDNTYLLVADSLKGQLYQKEEEIFRLEQIDNPTEEEQDLIEFLRLQKKRLELELD